jgi:hypothetical protein
LAKPRTPNEGSVYSGDGVAGASCIDPSVHKERGSQDDSVDAKGEGAGVNGIPKETYEYRLGMEAALYFALEKSSTANIWPLPSTTPMPAESMSPSRMLARCWGDFMKLW